VESHGKRFWRLFISIVAYGQEAAESTALGGLVVFDTLSARIVMQSADACSYDCVRLITKTAWSLREVFVL
jgi:hypothetical protein